jgi:hypothetical protein
LAFSRCPAASARRGYAFCKDREQFGLTTITTDAVTSRIINRRDDEVGEQGSFLDPAIAAKL